MTGAFWSSRINFKRNWWSESYLLQNFLRTSQTALSSYSDNLGNWYWKHRDVCGYIWKKKTRLYKVTNGTGRSGKKKLLKAKWRSKQQMFTLKSCQVLNEHNKQLSSKSLTVNPCINQKVQMNRLNADQINHLIATSSIKFHLKRTLTIRDFLHY